MRNYGRGGHGCCVTVDSDGNSIIRADAGENISGFRVIVLIDGEAFIHDPSNINHYGKAVGISKGAAVLGDTVEILMEGILETGTTLVSNTVYYAGANGIPTTTSPTSGIWLIVGYCYNGTKFFVDIEDAILR